MTRRVVAIEGKQTLDGRLILPGAISMRKDTIPVGNGGYTERIGMAGLFGRDEETGEISLEISTVYNLTSLNVHVTLNNLVINEDSMVIESADLIGVFISIDSSAWPELNRKE
jgi:hypothetical protein